MSFGVLASHCMMDISDIGHQRVNSVNIRHKKSRIFKEN
jgi:hypothetical protein